MRSNQSLFLITFIGFFLTQNLKAQVPTIQDCLGAIPVCQQIYTEVNSPSGDGNYVDELNVGFTCLAFESNAIWYTFTTNSAGNFGFVVTPMDLDDDYDWALYNITGASCEDIRNDDNLLVSCNAAGGFSCHGMTGATGGTIYNLQGGGCGSNPPTLNSGFDPENELVMVQANNTYVLMVSNWSGSTNGYTIDFGISDVDIFDFRKPELVSDEFPDGCAGDQILLSFDENILCSSLALGNFSLNGPSGSHSLQVSSPLCDSGSLYERNFTAIADPPITESGLYTLSFCCLSDACGNELDPVVLNYTVTIVNPPNVDFGPDQTLCVGESIDLDATSESAQYSWNNGQTGPSIQVTQSGTYQVNVTNACGSASDEIDLVFIEAPSFDLGPMIDACTGEIHVLDASSSFANYMWNTGATTPEISVTTEGQYSVVVENQCGTFTDMIDVSFSDMPMVDLGPDQDICPGESIQLEASFPDAVIQWQDGSIGNTIQVTNEGTYAVSVTNSCGQATDQIEVNLLATPNFDLGPEQYPCDGEVITLTASGNSTNFMWSTGESTPSIDVTTTGLYSVIAENQCGTFADEVQINFSEDVFIEFENSSYLCDPIVLKALEDYSFAEYLWQDGSTGQSFQVSQPGEYWLELSSGCKIVRDTIQIFECEECNVYYPNIFSPNNDGVNDEFTLASPCILDKYSLIIYDRWGNQVFQSDDINDSWKGKMDENKLTPGVYPYYLDYEVTVNGIKEERKKTGTVTLLSN